MSDGGKKKPAAIKEENAPVRFDEQVVRELGQVVVLEVQDFQLGSLQPLGQAAQSVPARQQLPEAPAGQQPATKTQTPQSGAPWRQKPRPHESDEVQQV